jgi:NDP-sugar pyrophosphorylase family protein
VRFVEDLDAHGCTVSDARRRARIRAIVCAMRAMLLCAGLSTRLGKLGAERPKPMLPVCGIPILAYGIANLVAHGVRDIVINTHHRADIIKDEIGDGGHLGARIQYIHEEQILGTGGGLKHALALLDPDGTDEPFISHNGKLIFDLDISALRAAYHRVSDSLGMMVVQRVPNAKEWGAVEVQHDARGPIVTNILGDGEHMFCGVHITRPSVMARLPDGESDSIRQGYLPWLRAGERVGAFEHEGGYFAEHSTPERYLASNWALLDGQTLRNPPSTRLSGIDPTAQIASSATIIEPVRIAARAQIAPGVTVGPYAVVGKGAHVERSISRAVVWSDGTIVE